MSNHQSLKAMLPIISLPHEIGFGKDELEIFAGYTRVVIRGKSSSLGNTKQYSQHEYGGPSSLLSWLQPNQAGSRLREQSNSREEQSIFENEVDSANMSSITHSYRMPPTYAMASHNEGIYKRARTHAQQPMQGPLPLRSIRCVCVSMTGAVAPPAIGQSRPAVEGFHIGIGARRE